MLEIKCEYCNGRPLVERKSLMSNFSNEYSVFINECNYIEDSVIGGSVEYSLYGIKFNYCPMCGRKLE